MNPKLRELLLMNDIQGSWETPPGADWTVEISRIRELIPVLESSLQTSLRLDDGVQDASFIADVGVLSKLPDANGVIHLCYRICVRFSWFGGLFSIYGENFDEYNTLEAIRVLSGHGYTYVPAAELDDPYDGLNEPYEKGMTWWVRYFDYL